MSEVEETKICPFCGGKININAIKCKHCKKFIKDDTKNNLILFVFIFFALICFIALIMIFFKFENAIDNNKNEPLESTNTLQNKNEISQIQEYDKIFNDVERYQEKYWKTIKKHHILLQVGEFNKDYYNDVAELNNLFTVIEDKINKDNYYLNKLNSIIKKDNAKTQYNINMNAGEYNSAIDEVLNELYQEIRKTIPASDFEKLKQSEIKWLNDIKDYEKVYYSEDRGSMGGMLYANMLANMRKFRTLLLIPYLSDAKVIHGNNTTQKTSSIQKKDYLGEWDDLYSQRAQLEISDVGSYIKVIVNWSSSAVESTMWTFECKFDDNTGNLMCKNGEQIERYPIKNGKRMYGAVSTYSEDPDGVEEETVRQNMQAIISIKKGNLKTALNEVDYIGDKNEAIKIYKNMTLKITANDLSRCVFVK